MVYTRLALSNNSLIEKTLNGYASAAEKIKAAPQMSNGQLISSGLDRYYANGAFIADGENFLLEFEKLYVQTVHVRRGTQYVYRTVREMTGAKNLHDGTVEELAIYHALLKVVAASGQIEHHHDPDAVHLTPELMRLVMLHTDRTEAILGYISTYKVTARDIDLQHLAEYLTNVAPALGNGYL